MKSSRPHSACDHPRMTATANRALLDFNARVLALAEDRSLPLLERVLIHRAHVTPIEAQLDAEKDAIIDCMHTDEFRVAVKKFSSKGK